MPRAAPLDDVTRLRLVAERCIIVLGSGVLQCPTNTRVRERLSTGELGAQQFYRQLQLRLLQTIAWTLGERLQILPTGSAESRQTYLTEFASVHLSRTRPNQLGAQGLAGRLQRVLSGVSQGDAAIGIATWGSPLFDCAGVEDLAESDLSDEHVAALVSMVRREVCGDLETTGEPSPTDIQVLGRVHEWLLELQLVVNLNDWSVGLETVAGHARRSTGSYFTPPDLVDDLLNLVLEPALDERIRGLTWKAAEAAILKLRVVDPACGTGIFLLAAARRIAARLDSLRNSRTRSKRGSKAGELSEVILQCLYGVDIGDTAVWLCRLALWFECGPPFEPQPALDRHVLCGNSIFGAWPGNLEQGIPDIAFSPAEKDDVNAARALMKRNRSERVQSIGGHAAGDSIEMLADLWCATFVWPKGKGSSVPTQATIEALQSKKKPLTKQRQAELGSLKRGHRFFHWHLRFPEVFSEHSHGSGAPNGFDLVIGNPPWVAHAGRSTQRLPMGVKHFNLHGYASFRGYPTTHGVFVEMSTRILTRGGRLGLIVPASVADLDGYAPTRESHDQECELTSPLPDYGEGRFAGVTQPCIALVSQRTGVGREPSERGKPWQLNRLDLDDVGAALLARWERHRPFPADLFGERGFQSTPDLRRHFCRLPNPDGRFTLALREGADVREFQLGVPGLYADARALGSILRPSSEFAQVTVVIRQTARYPIAAPSDGLAFRNSLLAVLSHRQWPWQLILCLLNSSLFRWCHYHRYRDGRQPILPQLKVGHLRSLAAPLVHDAEALSALETLGEELAKRNSGIQASERATLDSNVAIVYGLTPDEHQMVTRWHAERPR